MTVESVPAPLAAAQRSGLVARPRSSSVRAAAAPQATERKRAGAPSSHDFDDQRSTTNPSLADTCRRRLVVVSIYDSRSRIRSGAGHKLGNAQAEAPVDNQDFAPRD
jgi:hypothetical protein